MGHLRPCSQIQLSLVPNLIFWVFPNDNDNGVAGGAGGAGGDNDYFKTLKCS